jgi:ubiquinone/menaquinone biosynthesis C-methylase UbiE
MRKRSQDASTTAVAAWYRQDGARFLSGLGIRSGDRVLDFGCGMGGYAIPLAQAVGSDGKVIAVDNNPTHLEALRARLAEEPNRNVVDVRLTAGDVTLDWVADHFLDGVLLFDVLQFVFDWDRLFSTLRRLLKPKGLVLINPSHLSHPGEVDVKRLKERMKDHGFVLERTKRASVMHYDFLSEEEILVFRAAKGPLA